MVKKFGGSSLANTQRIQHIAQQILEAHKAGEQQVVVLSAMGDSTDKLVELANCLQTSPDPREYARLLASGEQVSIALLSMALLQLGIKARSYTAEQLKILTDARYKQARILSVATERLHTDLADGRVPIVAGFQGISHDGDVTVLGRGGSDTTAVALAAALRADECQIYTDVAGVYTTDPRIEPQARLLPVVSSDVMLEFAQCGAQVMQAQAVEYAAAHGVALRVLSSFVDGPGSLISPQRGKDSPEGSQVLGVAGKRQQAYITITGITAEPGKLKQVVESMHQFASSLQLLGQEKSDNGGVNAFFSIDWADFSALTAKIEQICAKNSVHNIISDAKIATLSLVGSHLTARSEILAQVANILEREQIIYQLTKATMMNITVVINEMEFDRAIRALHGGFDLAGTHIGPDPQKVNVNSGNLVKMVDN